MAVTQGQTTVSVLSESIAKSIASGAPSRSTLGAKDAAFAWSTGMPRGFWSFTSTALVDGPGFTALTIKPSGTPVGKVTEGGTKNTAVTVTPRTLPLAKYAGLASFSMEKSSYSDVLPQAVASCLISGALVALEADCAAEAVAQAGSSLTGAASWQAGILAGIGRVAGNGGNPNLLVMSPADFAAAVSGASQLVFSGTDAIPTYLGLALHLSPGIAAGTAVVMDAAAFVVAESSESPAVVVDPFTGAATNTVRLVADVMAVPAVVAPGNVVSVVPTITGTSAAVESKAKK